MRRDASDALIDCSLVAGQWMVPEMISFCWGCEGVDLRLYHRWRETNHFEKKKEIDDKMEILMFC